MNTLLPAAITGGLASTTKPVLCGLILFFALTLGWMGICGGAAIMVAHDLFAFPLSPLALISIGGLMPFVAALAAVGSEEGWNGVRTLFAQLSYRALFYDGRWAVVALIGMALIVLLASLLSRALGETQSPMPPATTWRTLPLLALVYFIIAVIEEVGWRGYALPRLQNRCGAFLASIILGLLWGFWHLPQWFIPATGQAAKWPFGVFLLHTIAFSLLLTWLHNASGGNLWPIILAHAGFNLYPEPWAAAWQTLPSEQRGLYPVMLITVIETGFALLLVYWTTFRLGQLRHG